MLCQPGRHPPLLHSMVALLGDEHHTSVDVHIWQALCTTLCAVACTARGCAALAANRTFVQACHLLLPALVQQHGSSQDSAARLEALLGVLRAVTAHVQGRVMMLRSFQGGGGHCLTAAI